MTGKRDRIAKLSAERAALVDRMVQQPEASGSDRTIPCLQPGESAPFSYAEERTLLLERFQPGAPWRSVHIALRLQGALQIDAVSRAASAVVARHEILRARYVDVDNEVRRVIDKDAAVDVPLLDLSEAVDSQHEAETILREQSQAFDLERGPLVRLTLLRIGDDDHILSVAAHQVVCDGPSLRILLYELLTFYAKYTGTAVANLPPLPIQFADFAAWQRSPEQLAVQEEHLAFWRANFDTRVSELRIAGDSAANGAPPPRTALLTSALPKSRLAALTRAASEQQATLYMILLTAFQALLGRYSGRQEFLVGSPSVNRPHRELEFLIGPFADILPLRADLSGDPTLETLIRRVKAATLEAFSHPAAYERIAEETQIPRLSTAIVLHEPLRTAAPQGPLKISAPPTAPGAMPYDLRLSFLEVDSALIASLEFQDNVFSNKEGQVFLSDLDQVLAAIVNKPETRLSSIPNLSRTTIQPAPPSSEKTSRTPRTGAGGPPRDRLERDLATLWENVLGVSNVGMRDNFFALGGNSLSAVRLFLLIENSLGKRLPLSVLLEAQTVEALARILRDGGFSRRWTCLVPLQPVGARPPFFCVHGAGGNILFLRELAHHLGRNQPLYGFQATGLDGETPPLTSVEEAARLYIEELRTVQPHGPYYLGGYCYGAYAALEMAQQLQKQGDTVALLVSFNETGAQRTVESVDDAVDLHRNTLSRLSPARRLQYLGERVAYRMTRIGGLALVLLGRAMGAGRSGSAGAQLRVERATHAAGMRYEPKPYEGRFALFRSETVAEPRGETFWQQTIQGEIESHVFPGGEDELFKEPSVALLAEQLSDSLERARRAGGWST